MITLHAAFSESNLLFWGESFEQANIDAKKRQTSTAYFGAGVDSLENLALELGFSPIAKAKRKSKDQASAIREALIWLPSADRRPVASLIEDLPEASCSIASWTVNVLQLE